ncbi:hypothetical protein IW148_003753 [Coemansia sp. RSA 1199]|nr:hypothetical protein IW148_003753 [Coemansia sp. RSA 1199]
METVHGAPDVWQQLQQLRLGDPVRWALELPSRLMLGLPVRWVRELPDRLTDDTAQAGAHGVAPARSALSGDAILAAGAEGVHILGMFGSRFFLAAMLAGFVISRIHVLVHRQRVRALGAAARIALHLPVQLLLWRALAQMSVVLAAQNTQGGLQWMRAAVSAAAEAARACGVDATADGAMWSAFSTVCLFDCVDVFVARLEGSPCAPYEFIGELIERTSLFYFYGTSVRVQELALLGVVEKLLLGAMLLALPNGWRWRLIPTAISNVLRLLHFAASMCSQSTPYAIYPLVHVMSMALLAVSLAIVLVTVAVLSLARLVDRLGFAHRVPPPAPLTVALYDRRGVFQGVANDGADDDALLELTADVPIVPDLRRDFSVEILDLAAACLQQFSTQIRSTGLARPCGAVRLPKTTALDEYVDHVVASGDHGHSAFLAENEHSHSGFAAFVEDEPTALGPAPSNSFGLAHVLNDTRANSVRRLSLGVWALIAALGHYALERKMGSLDPAAAKGRRRANKLRRLDMPDPALADYCIDDDADDDASSDYDFICATSDTSDASDDELEPDGLVGETAALVADILSGADDDLPTDRLAAAVAFMAHSLVDSSTGGPAVMTRSMYTRQMTHAEVPGVPLLGTLAGLYQSDIASTAVAAPFARSETDALAQLIHSRRTTEPRGDDTRSLCVVCWANARCVMLRPCRCLCLCNDCRAALVVRNFDHCPCCRRTVSGYSRVYAV